MEDKDKSIIDTEEVDGVFVGLSHEPKYTTGMVAEMISRDTKQDIRQDMVNYWFSRFISTGIFPDARREEKTSGTKKGRALFSQADIVVLKRVFKLKEGKATDEYVVSDIKDWRSPTLLSEEKSTTQKVQELLGNDPEYQKQMSALIKAGIDEAFKSSGVLEILESYKTALTTVDGDKVKLLESQQEDIQEKLTEITTALDEKTKENDELRQALEEEKKKKRPLFSFGKKD